MLLFMTFMELLVYTVHFVQFVDASSYLGCPIWGCEPSGSFAFNPGVPVSNATVSWSTEISHGDTFISDLDIRGCVSDSGIVVCATPKGYVSVDATTGQQKWSYTGLSSPHLPVMNFNGNIIGMDARYLVVLHQDTGTLQKRVNVSMYQPAFSGKLAENGVFLITSSQKDTDQVAAYDTGNFVISSTIPLRGHVEGVYGTFMPDGHPIMAGNRAYVITTFVPDSLKTHTTLSIKNVHRLNALDLSTNPRLRIILAWYFDMMSTQRKLISRNTRSSLYSAFQPFMIYSHGNLYINIADSPGADARLEQPFGGTIWHLKDNGKSAHFVYKTPGVYGQMAMYSNPDLSHDDHQLEDSIVWIETWSPSAITGYSAKNGSLLGNIPVYNVCNVTWIMSYMAVTRQINSSNDVLIIGGVDNMRDALVVAIETDSSARAKMLWQTKLNAPRPANETAAWTMGGQIVGTTRKANSVQIGIAALVVENGNSYNKFHVKGIF